jgi:hypothetical protein
MALGDRSQPSKRLKMNVAAGKEYICEPSLACRGNTRDVDLLLASIDLVDDRSVQLYNEPELPDPEHYDHAIVNSFARNVTHMQDFEDIGTLRKIK